MGTFADIRTSTLALNRACGRLSFRYDHDEAMRLQKAMFRWEPPLREPITDSSLAEEDIRRALSSAAIALSEAVAAAAKERYREDLQALVVQRTKDYQLEVLRAAVAYNWLPALPEDAA